MIRSNNPRIDVEALRARVAEEKAHMSEPVAAHASRNLPSSCIFKPSNRLLRQRRSARFRARPGPKIYRCFRSP